MSHDTLTITLIGGPTALLEVAGLRLLTDPTFSPPGAYPTGAVTLTKLTGPAMELEAIGDIDAVLLSHDQHADNLDPAGRACLASARRVLTTKVGADRLSEEFWAASRGSLLGIPIISSARRVTSSTSQLRPRGTGQRASSPSLAR